MVFNMAKVRIYQPDKSATQSGKGRTKQWLLEFVSGVPMYVEGLMGWTGSRDTTQQIRLSFPTREAAVDYAKCHGLDFEVFEPKRRALVRKTYADNFRFDRVTNRHP